MRFLFANNISDSDSDSDSDIDDDFQQAEKTIESFLVDFQNNLINVVSSSSIIMGNKRKSLEINRSLANFNSDFDLLLTNVKLFFSQPTNYRAEVTTLLQEQTQHIASLKNNNNLLKGISYLEIEELDLLHKKAKFLTLQYYSDYEEIDLQADTDITLINNLFSIWDEYDHFLDKQEKRINSIIEAEGVKSSQQIKEQADTLFLTLLIGAILITIVLAFWLLNQIRSFIAFCNSHCCYTQT